MKFLKSVISVVLFSVGALSANAQTTNYTSGAIDVDVTVENACEGGTNGSITFTVNASSQPSVTLSAVLGPPSLITPVVIPVLGSYTFDDAGEWPSWRYQL